MAKYRQVHVDFWQDGFVLDLTPEEKYFYVYLMTNSKTSQCGIYELPKRIIETETGYSKETVDKLLQRFIDYEKILYDDSTKEIMLINWVKYNAIKSSTVVSCIRKELDFVKNKQFIKYFHTLCIRYEYPIGTLSIDQGEEQEQEEEEEREKEQQQEKVFLSADDFYQNNFGVINPFIADCIGNWVKDLNEELVIEAMKRALAQQKKWKYAEGILKNWANQNIRSLEDVAALDLEFSNGGSNDGKEYRRGNGRVASKSKDTIFGNKVGRY